MLRKENKTASQVKDFYEDFHTRIYLEGSARFNRWLLKILAPGAGIRFLDIACGRGYLLAEAGRRGIFCYGVEISENAVSVARKQKANTGLVVSDAEYLPWKGNFFDMITCLGSLEHFLHPELALSEMLRVAKDNACFCILVPNLFSWDNIEMVKRTGQPPTHSQELERFATRWQWQSFLEENGLRVKKVLKYNGFPNLFEVKNGRIKLKSIRKFFRRFFISFNLCSSFIFICVKKNIGKV